MELMRDTDQTISFFKYSISQRILVCFLVFLVFFNKMKHLLFTLNSNNFLWEIFLDGTCLNFEKKIFFAFDHDREWEMLLRNTFVPIELFCQRMFHFKKMARFYKIAFIKLWHFFRLNKKQWQMRSFQKNQNV